MFLKFKFLLVGKNNLLIMIFFIEEIKNYFFMVSCFIFYRYVLFMLNLFYLLI